MASTKPNHLLSSSPEGKTVPKPSNIKDGKTDASCLGSLGQIGPLNALINTLPPTGEAESEDFLFSCSVLS